MLKVVLYYVLWESNQLRLDVEKYQRADKKIIAYYKIVCYEKIQIYEKNIK